MLPDRVINVHGHLHQADDIRERIKVWEKWNVVKFCCACLRGRWSRPEMGGYFGNEDFPRARKEYGDILAGLAAVGLGQDGLDGPADIQRYREQGFEGLKFIDPKFPYNHDAYYPLYERAEALGMPVLFHTGYVNPGPRELLRKVDVDSDRMRPLLFDRIARAFPDLKIIGAHLGGAHKRDAVEMLVHPNVHFDLCGSSGRKHHVRDLLRALMPHASLETDMADPEENPALGWFRKLVFGTDNPPPSVWIPNSELILDRLEIPADTRRKYYHDTAATMFGWA